MPDRRAIDSETQVIVGLGNPEPRHSGTPHNVGFEVVDRIAESLRSTWEAHPDAWIAHGTAHGRRVCLVKTRVGMNLTGGALKHLAETLGFDPKQCILVYDDLDTPLGSIRTRLSGGAGGHRGVASILEAFQTDAFRRVKVGVGQPDTKLNRVDYVLSPIAEADRPAIDTAVSGAVKRALELVASRDVAVA
jgi:PTH1 family peptidyl-tRNA hydrolase